MEDEAGKIDLNMASDDLLESLLLSAGVPAANDDNLTIPPQITGSYQETSGPYAATPKPAARSA